MVIKCSKNYWMAMQDSKIRMMWHNIVKLWGLVYSYFISVGQRGTQKSAPNTSSPGFAEASSSLPLWCPPAKNCVPTHRPMLCYIYIMPPSYIHPTCYVFSIPSKPPYPVLQHVQRCVSTLSPKTFTLLHHPYGLLHEMPSNRTPRCYTQSRNTGWVEP